MVYKYEILEKYKLKSFNNLSFFTQQFKAIHLSYSIDG